ncbi:MAG TPA: hypothetical protein VGM92_04825, partial [Candidatus Kapabacteria bacterium]
AYFYRSTRYEALAFACMLLRKSGRNRDAYMYSCLAPKPSNDVIFVEKSAEWRLLEEHAIASAALGIHPEAVAFFEYALQYDMDDVHRERMERNMERMRSLKEKEELCSN